MFKKLSIIVFSLFLLASCVKTPDSNLNYNELWWKKTYLWFVWTYCPYCRDDMPTLQKFYDKYKEQVNMQLIVLDQKIFPGWYTIPQDLTNPFSYTDLTWEECNSVPSYIILDENNQPITKQCWWKLTFEELEEILLDDNLNIQMDNSYQLSPLENWDKVALMTTTNWTFKIKLFTKEAPKTALNFMALAQNWYYDWLIFHRVIKDFMIQWWDPEWTWMWWQSVFWEAFEDEFSDKLRNIRGSLSMANSGPNTNGSQFFINQKDNNFLDNKHSVFGQVVEGLDNLDKIAGSKTDENDKPEKDIKIIKIEVFEYQNWTLKDIEKIDIDAFLEELEAREKARIEELKNKEVKAWDTISVHYIWTITQTWEEFDNSYNHWTTLDFEVGAWNMIAWFDEWVLWMKIWEKKTIMIDHKDAYGEYTTDNIEEIPLSELEWAEESWFPIAVWTKIPLNNGFELTITEVLDESVKVYVNHFLAWKDLTFEIELVDFKN